MGVEMKRSDEIVCAIKLRSQAMEILAHKYQTDIHDLVTELSEILAGDKPDVEISLKG